LQAIDACDVANLRYARQDVKGVFDLRILFLLYFIVQESREYCSSCLLLVQ
jgi:hypothetical protein